MITFNAESIKQAETSSTGFFESVKGIFPALKIVVDAAGDNPAVDALIEMALQAEKMVNDTVLPRFMDFRQGVATYVDNIDEWNARCARMEPVNASNLQNAEVTNNVTPVTFN